MQSLLVALFCVSFVVAATGAPKSWPESFSINFNSNITTDVSTPIVPVPGVMYYDWTVQMQRVDHGAGAYECVSFYDTPLPCTLIFNNDGLYRILQQPLPEGQDECCLDLDFIHASAPDWAANENPTFNGMSLDAYSGFNTNKYTFDNYDPAPDTPHTYFEVADIPDYIGGPVLFTFPGNEGRQDYHYEVTSMKVESQDKSLFDIPVECTKKMCTSSKRAHAKKN
jgi:hypothetical protein